MKGKKEIKDRILVLKKVKASFYTKAANYYKKNPEIQANPYSTNIAKIHGEIEGLAWVLKNQ